MSTTSKQAKCLPSEPINIQLEKHKKSPAQIASLKKAQSRQVIIYPSELLALRIQKHFEQGNSKSLLGTRLFKAYFKALDETGHEPTTIRL